MPHAANGTHAIGRPGRRPLGLAVVGLLCASRPAAAQPTPQTSAQADQMAQSRMTEMCKANPAACAPLFGELPTIDYKFHSTTVSDQGHKTCTVTATFHGAGQFRTVRLTGKPMGSIDVDAVTYTETCNGNYPGQAPWTTNKSNPAGGASVALGPASQGGGFTGSGIAVGDLPTDLVNITMSFKCATPACLPPAPVGATVEAHFHGVATKIGWKPQIDMDFVARFGGDDGQEPTK